MGPALKDLPVGVAAAAAGTWTSAMLWPADSTISITGLVRFLIRFLSQSVIAGVDIATRAFAPNPALKPGFVIHHSAVPAGMARDVACAVMSLQPGKLPVAADASGTLLVHCLDLRQPVQEQISADEAAFHEVLHGVQRHG